MNDDALLGLLDETADAVQASLGSLTDWGLAGTRAGQHHSDLAADAAAVDVLLGASVGVLSEESGLHDVDREIVVIVDPLDGSTNAARGIPWFATSLCAVDQDGPRVALVTNLATGDRFEATRGRGARRNGAPITPNPTGSVDEAIIGLSGYPPGDMGWHQYRALGAIALDLCAVAAGVLDGYVDCSVDAHGVWDYLAAALICHEAGAVVVDAAGRDLLSLDPADRRTPVAAGTHALLDQLQAARTGWPITKSTSAPST